MTTGYWINQDGLPLQFGTAKAQTAQGGDYLVFGETREFEQLINLVPLAMGAGGVQIPAPPTTFSGTSTPIAAGIQQLTNIIPLQTTAPVLAASSSLITFTAPQIFFESVEVETIIPAVGGTSINVGLVSTVVQNSGQSQTAGYVQIAPNAGVQLINGLTTANMGTIGYKAIFTQSGSTGMLYSASNGSPIAGGGSWIGTNIPVPTNTIYGNNGAATVIPSKAYVSTIATGPFTSGLVKLRLRYTIVGNIAQ
jgi:hypothetical protein